MAKKVIRQTKTFTGDLNATGSVEETSKKANAWLVANIKVILDPVEIVPLLQDHRYVITVVFNKEIKY